MEKVNLPIKTKIAALWIIVIGGGGLVYSIVTMIKETFILLVLPPFSLFFFFLPGLFLLKRKKWAWVYAIIILSIGTLLFTTAFIYNLLIEYEIKDVIAAGKFLLVFFPPFILLLLDCKNFWKIIN